MRYHRTACVDALAPAYALTCLFDRWHLTSDGAELFARRGRDDRLPVTRSGVRLAARLAGLHLSESELEVVLNALVRLCLDAAHAAAGQPDDLMRDAARCSTFVAAAERWAAAVRPAGRRP